MENSQDIKPMNRKQLREHYGVSKRTFAKLISALPAPLRKLVPNTNGIIFPGALKRLISHWDLE